MDFCSYSVYSLYSVSISSSISHLVYRNKTETKTMPPPHLRTNPPSTQSHILIPLHPCPHHLTADRRRIPAWVGTSSATTPLRTAPHRTAPHQAMAKLRLQLQPMAKLQLQLQPSVATPSPNPPRHAQRTALEHVHTWHESRGFHTPPPLQLHPRTGRGESKEPPFKCLTRPPRCR